MENTKLYKHLNNRDVAIYILSSKENDSSLHLRVKWYNLNYHGFCSDKIDEITINKSELHNWSILESF